MVVGGGEALRSTVDEDDVVVRKPRAAAHRQGCFQPCQVNQREIVPDTSHDLYTYRTTYTPNARLLLLVDGLIRGVTVLRCSELTGEGAQQTLVSP